METTLDTLENGQKGVITKIKARGPFNRRLRDMGVTPGSEVCVEGRAPLGDPLNVKIKGFSLAVRNTEAEKIFVELTR